MNSFVWVLLYSVSLLKEWKSIFGRKLQETIEYFWKRIELGVELVSEFVFENNCIIAKVKSISRPEKVRLSLYIFIG